MNRIRHQYGGVVREFWTFSEAEQKIATEEYLRLPTDTEGRWLHLATRHYRTQDKDFWETFAQAKKYLLRTVEGQIAALEIIRANIERQQNPTKVTFEPTTIYARDLRAEFDFMDTELTRKVVAVELFLTIIHVTIEQQRAKPDMSPYSFVQEIPADMVLRVYRRTVHEEVQA